MKWRSCSPRAARPATRGAGASSASRRAPPCGDPGRRVLASVAQCCGVSSDADLLEVALTNLLGNSWQLTAQRDEAHIEVGELAIDGERAVSARDDGAGFDLAHAGKLFQPFERLHKAADYPGTGIGLATVRRIVVRLGGRYWAEGAPDKGAAFYYTVPDEAEKTA